MDKKVGVFQIATVFIGSIVGAGLSSGRELNQFFSVYGYKSMLGLVMCALSYIIVGKMMIEISRAHKTKSYSEFVSLVCHRKVAWFTNVTLTLFLVCSTGIILAGSSAVINQYFGVPKWIGFVVMIGCSIIFLLRNTNGLFEVNRFVVPCLLLIMTSIFIGFIKANPQTLSLHYLQALPTEKTHYWPSSIVYASFNIISIVGIIVPLTYELQDTKVLVRGVALGSALLTLISFFISFLMLVNPTYPMTYEIPILAVAGQVGPLLPTGLERTSVG